MNSRAWFVHAIGLLVLGLLLLVAVPFYADQIPGKIGAQVRDVLQRSGLTWVAVKMEGRDVELSGRAPTPSAYQQAVQVVEAVPGVRHVSNKMVPRVVNPYTLNIGWENDRLTVEGFVPDEASHQKIKTLVASLYGSDAAVAKLELAQGNPEGWTALLETLFTHIRKMEHAQIELSGQQLFLSGRTRSSLIREQSLKALKEFEGKGYNASLHLVATDSAFRVCQQKFNELLKTPIVFASGKARIEERSFPLLKRLAETATLCPNARIRIVGHTDNMGDGEANQSLSVQRAQAVIGHLFLEGVETERLQAVGFGAKRPVADNATEEGRAKNRRIEFVVQGN